MAKKTITVEHAINQWETVMRAASPAHYFYVDNIIVTTNPDTKKLFVIAVDQKLWEEIRKPEASTIRLDAFSLTDDNTKAIQPWFKYGRFFDELDGWVSLIDEEGKLYSGQQIEIKIAGREDPILVHKDFLPIRLKKAEYTDIHYRVFLESKLNVPDVVVIKKRFSLLEEHGFTIARIYKII